MCHHVISVLFQALQSIMECKSLPHKDTMMLAHLKAHGHERAAHTHTQTNEHLALQLGAWCRAISLCCQFPLFTRQKHDFWHTLSHSLHPDLHLTPQTLAVTHPMEIWASSTMSSLCCTQTDRQYHHSVLPFVFYPFLWAATANGKTRLHTAGYFRSSLLMSQFRINVQLVL